MFLPPTLTVGPITIASYGIIVASGVGVAYTLARKQAQLYNLTPQIVDDSLAVLICTGLIGARLYHVLDKWRYYQQNPFEILAVWHGGLAIYGAIIGSIVGLWFFAARRRLPLAPLLDLVAPCALLGQAIGRFGNYANQEAFGHPTNLPWGIFIAPEKRPWFWQNYTHFHPTFFYESMLDLLGFLILLKLRRKYRTHPGQVFSLYLIFYGLIRLVVEHFRFDTAAIGSVKIASVLSLASIGVGVLLWISIARAKHDKKHTS